MKYLPLLILSLIATIALPAQQTDFEKDTRKLLRVTGAGEIGVQTMDQMFEFYKQNFTNAPMEFWDEMKKEVTASELVDLIVPIYMKFYTHDEILGLIEFYQTPLGQKTVNVLPQVTNESMLVGQQWGAELAERVEKRLREKGYIE